MIYLRTHGSTELQIIIQDRLIRAIKVASNINLVSWRDILHWKVVKSYNLEENILSSKLKTFWRLSCRTQETGPRYMSEPIIWTIQMSYYTLPNSPYQMGQSLNPHSRKQPKSTWSIRTCMYYRSITQGINTFKWKEWNLLRRDKNKFLMRGNLEWRSIHRTNLWIRTKDSL